MKEEITGFTDFLCLCLIFKILNENQKQKQQFVLFLANTGGLLGLFMGFSVVSLVEIFYFTAVRPIFKRHHHGKNNNTTRKSSELCNRIKPFVQRSFQNERINSNIIGKNDVYHLPYLN